MFTATELEYIKSLVLLSKESLDDVCDEDGYVNVDWMKQEDVDTEYELIDAILDKIK